MTERLHIDLETRSRLDLTKVGVYKYVEEPSTDVWCAAYAFDDEPEVYLWIPAGPAPARIVSHLRHRGEIHAWNASFERIVWRLLSERYGWPMPVLEQFVDSAAAAAAMALPRKLANAARVLGVGHQIDPKKHARIKRMARPRKPTKNNPSEWWDTPDRLAELYEDCRQDVRAERAISTRLRPLGAFERETYLLDQRINDRGVPLDLELVAAAKRLSVKATERANAELEELTGVESVTQVAKLKEWLALQGQEVESLSKDVVRDMLSDETPELPPDVYRAIELRSTTAKSSLGKLEAMERVACADGRARGLLLYHGASTGRWSGKHVQPQNFPRPLIKWPEQYIAPVFAGEYDLIEMEHPVLLVLADLLRSTLRAEPDKRFLSADFAQIEARVVAWIAGQDDLVQMFADGGKVYEDMAAFIQTRKLGRRVTANEIKNPSEERTVLGKISGARRAASAWGLTSSRIKSAPRRVS